MIALGLRFTILFLSVPQLVLAEGLSSTTSTLSCEDFTSTFSEKDSTQNLIIFLERAIGEPAIWKEHTPVHWFKNFAEGSLVNPFHSSLGVGAGLWARAYERLVQNADLDRQKIKSWARRRHEELSRESLAKGKVIHATQESNLPMLFSDMNLRVGDQRIRDPRGIHDPFWEGRRIHLMTTPVTQHQWVSMMGQNPSSHASGGTSRQLGHQVVLLNPDHPVESVSIAQVKDFLALLNNEHVSKTLLHLIPDHQPGDVYTVPNSDLWMRLQSFSTPYSANSLNGNSFGDFMWYSENSGSRTQPVGQLRPFDIDGRAIYDFYGLVKIWLIEHWTPDHLGQYLGTRGGLNCEVDEKDLRHFDLQRSVRVEWLSPRLNSETTGLRLIRAREGGVR